MNNLEMIKVLVPDEENKILSDVQYSTCLSLNGLNPEDTFLKENETPLFLSLAESLEIISRKKHEIVKMYQKGEISKEFLETDFNAHAKDIRRRYTEVR